MAERLTLCPVPTCKSRWVKTVEILNPDTTNMNARAKLQCETCGHEWEGLVTSPYHKRQREHGWIR